MRVHSFIRHEYELCPVEVEVSLLPGLPQISILGLPDAAIKESVGRIKSALKQQGFEIPKAHQVLVHLRPSDLRKHSRGLDLAIAVALLWETEQVPKTDWIQQRPFIYGELSLKGEVETPQDIEEVVELQGRPLLTGRASNLTVPSYQIQNLRDLLTPSQQDAHGGTHEFRRPSLKDLSFPKPVGELLQVVAAGEHPTLFLGPAGSGKTTVASCVNALLAEPSMQQWMELRKMALHFGYKLDWRPVVAPHHTASNLALIGGGNRVRPGEISRAHGGVLILDELLEFSPEVQEALREPLESGQIEVARDGRFKRFPADFLLLATSNLCPCGHWTPQTQNECHCRGLDLQRYLKRLRGPVVDRFAILSFSSQWSREETTVSLQDILWNVQSAIEFRRSYRLQVQPNHKLQDGELPPLSTTLDALFKKKRVSRRRFLSIRKVARTLADLENSLEIQASHWARATDLCWTPFLELERAL